MDVTKEVVELDPEQLDHVSGGLGGLQACSSREGEGERSGTRVDSFDSLGAPPKVSGIGLPTAVLSLPSDAPAAGQVSAAGEIDRRLSLKG